MELIRYISPYKKQFALGSLAKLAEAMLELYLPILMARILDIGIPGGDRDFILRTGAWILALALAGMGFATLCQYFAAVTSQGSGTNIRNALMDKISAFSYRELDKFGISTLINRLTTDVNYVQQAVAMTMRLVTRAPFICLGAVVMSIAVDRQLSLVFAGILPLLGLIVYLLLRLTAPLYRAVQARLDAFALVVRENLTGVRVIRAFARTKQEQRRAGEAAEALSSANIQVAGLSALMNPATSIVVNASVILVLWLGAGKVYAGRLSQGDLLALSTYAGKILYALLVIANLIVLFTKAAASAGRIREVLCTEPSIVETATALPQPVAGAPAVEFDAVSFAYHGGDNAVEALSFAAPRGAVLGIVGATGSGKTTVINLIQRFYDPDNGRVLLDGVPVRDWPLATLREHIGVATQLGALFSGSIADNLRMARPQATDVEILAALKTAQCEEFVSALAQGMHAPVREGGKNLSGGQRQRLLIARALVGRPPLLILDDSLSALDYATDLRLRKALAHDLADTTVIIVSQRLSSVMSADQILVLDNGAVAGLGTHAELLAGCETYREIHETQTDRAGGGAMGV